MKLLSFMQSLIDCPDISSRPLVYKAILQSEYSESHKVEMLLEINSNNCVWGLCNDETFFEAFDSRY